MALKISNELKTLILNMTNPVGSVYINSSNTNPGSVLGGTWVRVPNGYLRNNGTATGMATGGSLTSSSTAITTTQMPSHGHSINWPSGTADIRINSTSIAGSASITIGGLGGSIYGIPGANNTGSSQGHTHALEPSFVNVYAWRRTV